MNQSLIITALWLNVEVQQSASIWRGRQADQQCLYVCKCYTNYSDTSSLSLEPSSAFTVLTGRVFHAHLGCPGLSVSFRPNPLPENVESKSFVVYSVLKMDFVICQMEQALG